MLARTAPDARPLRHITQDELVNFIVNQANRPEINDGPFNWDVQLAAHGFISEFKNIDFMELRQALSRRLTKPIPEEINKNFSYLVFNHCKNINIKAANINSCMLYNCANLNVEGCTLTNCLVVNCTLSREALDSNIFMQSRILTNEEFNQSNIPLLWPVIASPLYHLYSSLRDTNKPLVVLLYMREHGTQMTDELYKYLLTKNFNIVSVHPADGMSHPVFQSLERINGFILPGGLHITTDPNKYGIREKFEISIIELSLRNTIPLLGICRGHQMLGHYFGGHVSNLSDARVKINHADDHEMVVSDFPGSLFHAMCIKKKHSGKTNSLVESSPGTFSLTSSCAHTQEVTFPRGKPDRIKITLTSRDGCIEGMQVGEHIITYQHHHEYFTQEHSDARGALGIFKKLVREHNKQLVSQPQPDPRPESTSRISP